MVDLNGGINLQAQAIRQIEQLFSVLHGWGNASNLNESGLPVDPTTTEMLDGLEMLDALELS